MESGSGGPRDGYPNCVPELSEDNLGQKGIIWSDLLLVGERIHKYSHFKLISTNLWIQFRWFPMVIVSKMIMLKNYISFSSHAGSWAPFLLYAWFFMERFLKNQFKD